MIYKMMSRDGTRPIEINSTDLVKRLRTPAYAASPAFTLNLFNGSARLIEELESKVFELEHKLEELLVER
jgi:hypothetical protein